MSQHLAAIFYKAGSPLEVGTRATPTPGPDEILLKVLSVALNPIDWYQRDFAMPPITYSPAVLGHDVAGIIVSHGSAVSASAPKPGTRVAAACRTFFVQGKPDYGAFQQYVLVPAENVCPLPDHISDNEGATIPMSVMTTWVGLTYQLGLNRDTKFTPEDKKGMLVWGAASSVGTGVIQIAKTLGFTVYATASGKNHAYLESRGVSRAFDYKSPDVVSQIVKAAKEDGITLNLGYLAVGDIKLCQEVLSAFKIDGTAKLASAPRVPEGTVFIEGVQTEFVAFKDPDAKGRLNFVSWINKQLEEQLRTGTFVPGPKVELVEGGLQGVNNGLDRMRGGVSGVKLVLEIEH